jgi:hypothetical protein
MKPIDMGSIISRAKNIKSLQNLCQIWQLESQTKKGEFSNFSDITCMMINIKYAVYKNLEIDGEKKKH